MNNAAHQLGEGRRQHRGERFTLSILRPNMHEVDRYRRERGMQITILDARRQLTREKCAAALKRNLTASELRKVVLVLLEDFI